MNAERKTDPSRCLRRTSDTGLDCDSCKFTMTATIVSMADEQPSLHIDTDWKKQAQEEKRKLAEQSAKTKEAAATPTAPVAAKGAVSGPVAPTRKPGRALPVPGFGSLVQSVMTQIFYYLGELASSGQAAIDLDLAKHHLDTLSMLEEKTKNNLSVEEQGILDAALYETRTRFVNVASQYLGP
jgi:Domain of unknown function (DUF1844)